MIDLFRAQQIAVVDDLNSFSLELDGYQGVPLLLPRPAEPPAVAQPPSRRAELAVWIRRRLGYTLAGATATRRRSKGGRRVGNRRGRVMPHSARRELSEGSLALSR